MPSVQWHSAATAKADYTTTDNFYMPLLAQPGHLRTHRAKPAYYLMLSPTWWGDTCRLGSGQSAARASPRSPRAPRGRGLLVVPCMPVMAPCEPPGLVDKLGAATALQMGSASGLLQTSERPGCRGVSAHFTQRMVVDLEVPCTEECAQGRSRVGRRARPARSHMDCDDSVVKAVCFEVARSGRSGVGRSCPPELAHKRPGCISQPCEP